MFRKFRLKKKECSPSSHNEKKETEYSSSQGSKPDTTDGLITFLNEIAQGQGSIQECTASALEHICSYTGWPVGHAYVITNEDPLTAESSKQWHIDSSIKKENIEEFKNLSEQTSFTSAKGLIGKVMASAAHMNVKDVTVLPGYVRADAASHNHLHGCFAFPVLDIDDGRVRAVLEFFSYDCATIDEQSLKLTHFVGNQIAFAYARADADERMKRLAELFEEKVKTAVANILQSSKEVAGMATGLDTAIDQVQSLSNESRGQSDNSLRELEVCSDNAQKLQGSTADIQNIAATIAKIADQTNLLALNATIEAARAGDVGRGFAVVADEVKTLSKHTTDSTGQVASLVANISRLFTNIEDAIDRSKSASQKIIDTSELLEQAVMDQKQRANSMDIAAAKLEAEAKVMDQTVNDFLREINSGE